MSWPRAIAPSLQSAVLKQQPADFQVTEHLSFSTSGDGEHCFLLIEKTGANTQWIVKKLAQQLKVRERDIGYAGLKDRHAITRQWFSIHLPGQDNPTEISGDEEFKVLRIERNNKKLKHGAIAYNHFAIRLRDCVGSPEKIAEHLTVIRDRGYPNYFGLQRFGHGGRNVEKAVAMLEGKFKARKNQRSIYLSALRSWFFNQLLARRIECGTWQSPRVGDRMQLAGTRSFFMATDDDTQLQQRLDSGDIHIAGPLPGEDAPQVMSEYAELVESIWQNYASMIEKIPSKTDWRALRVIPKALDWRFDDVGHLYLEFELPSGCYATELLSELGNVSDASLKSDEEFNRENTA